MYRKILIACFITSVLLSCGSGSVKKNDQRTDYLTRNTSAVFKNAELIFEDEWKIVFRKFDDYQYIIFLNNIEELNSFNYRFVCTDTSGAYKVCPDYINIRFDIDYIEATMADPVTGESVSINRIVNIIRTPSDRYLEAGITSDIDADDFIMKIKSLAKNSDAESLSQIISYPVNVYINRKKFNISGPEMFIRYYGQIFNTNVTSSLIDQSLGDIQADKKGLVIGKDKIRISLVDGKFLITEINNY